MLPVELVCFGNRTMNASCILSSRENGHALPKSQASPPPRILVVDDDEGIRLFNTRVLIDSGFEVDVASDGAAAWECLQLAGYDLLVTDNEMPGISGLELLRKLRAARVEMPVIMAAVAFPTVEFARSPWLRPEVMLFKPYMIEELVRAVRKVLCAANDPFARIAPPIDWRSLRLTISQRL